MLLSALAQNPEQSYLAVANAPNCSQGPHRHNNLQLMLGTCL